MAERGDLCALPDGTSLVLKRTVLARFESKIDGGTAFLYDAATGELRTTDRRGYDLARRLRRPCTVVQLCQDERGDEILVVRSYLQRLIDLGFLEVVTVDNDPTH